MTTMRELLVQTVQQLEALEEAKRVAREAFKDALDQASWRGLDKATLRAILKLRKLSPQEREERRALEAIYLANLDMLEGDELPLSARRRFEPPRAEPAQGEPAAPVADAAPAPAAPQGSLLPVVPPEQARAEGVQAAADGKRIYDNPYPAGDPARAAWDEGWCAGSGTNGMAIPEAFRRRDAKPPKPAGPPEGAGE